MDLDVRRALLLRSTNYKDLDTVLGEQLGVVAEQYGLTAKGLAAAFDKFMTVSRQESTSVSPEDVEAFSREYARSNAKAAAAAKPDTLFAKTTWDDMAVEATPADKAEPPAGGGGHNPPSQRLTPYMSRLPPKAAAAAGTPPSSSSHFRTRAAPGECVAVLNPGGVEAPDAAPGAAAMEVEGDVAEGRVEVAVLGRPMPPGARFMVDRLEDKVDYVDGRIRAVEGEIEAARAEGAEGGADDGGAEGCHPVGVACQEAAVFVGRVVCDTEEGRLNPQSVLLEGSVGRSGGARVRLDLSACAAGYRLFPGQVVAVRGTNPAGHCIAAAEVVPGLPLPMARTPMDELAAFAARTGRRGQSLVVAAGPFTTADDLAFEPLAALLEACRAAPPDVLLLLGPYVDAEHPLVAGGLLGETFQDIYESAVVGRLAAYESDVGGATRVLLMPSTRDVHAAPVFPQPPLGRGSGAAEALANPSTFRSNEVVVGATSADWLMAATREEVSRAAPGQAADRLPAMAAHVIAQRSYFPLYPPPLGAMLDTSHGASLALPLTPDLLLLPSDLAPFAKLVPVAAVDAASPQLAAKEEGRVVCINPGRLAKGSTGGTYASVYVAPLGEALDVASGKPAATNGAVLHRVDQRCRVEIKRI